MSEKIPGGPTAEEMGIKSKEELEKEKQDKEDQEYLELFKKDHPEVFAVPDAKREGEAEIAEFEAMIDAFETKHSMEALFAITDLTVAEAKIHPIREPAREDLALIFAKKKKIEQETNISREQEAILKARWKRISQAVGMINSNKVDHTR